MHHGGAEAVGGAAPYGRRLSDEHRCRRITVGTFHVYTFHFDHGVREGRPVEAREGGSATIQEHEAKGNERSTITYSAAISACEEGEAFRQCDALYEKAYVVGLLDHPLESCPTDMDIHGLCASIARAAVRFVLTDLRRTASSSCPMRDFNLVTGFSSNFPILPSSVPSPPHASFHFLLIAESHFPLNSFFSPRRLIARACFYPRARPLVLFSA